MAEEEAAVLHFLFELLVVLALVDTGISGRTGLLEDVVLNVNQQLLNIFHDSLDRT